MRHARALFDLVVDYAKKEELSPAEACYAALASVANIVGGAAARGRLSADAVEPMNRHLVDALASMLTGPAPGRPPEDPALH